MKELLNLVGKRALVTGSSQGIGRAIAVALAEFGADVMVHCARDVAKAEAVRAEVESYGSRSGITVADLADPGAADKIHNETLTALGPVDILVLNASVQIRRPWQEITLDEYRRQIDVNLGASIWLIQKFAPAMQRRRWGRILTIGSVQEVRPHPAMLVYSATKAAVENLARNLAPQLAPDGVTINNLAPGAIATGRNEQVLADESYRRQLLTKIPAGYIGEPVDCAGLAVLLCSEAGRYITGQDLFVDGGMGLP
ncbi:MAG: SDR family oxidoreductase [Thermoguttaceae bacterium]|nr:SDR family oxidoreductase [Thermoguttaceae bacterium]